MLKFQLQQISIQSTNPNDHTFMEIPSRAAVKCIHSPVSVLTSLNSPGILTISDEKKSDFARYCYQECIKCSAKWTQYLLMSQLFIQEYLLYSGGFRFLWRAGEGAAPCIWGTVSGIYKLSTSI